MAKFGMWKDAFLEVNGVDHSDHCAEVSLEESEEELTFHAHGDDVSQIAPGLQNWTVRATMFQDFAASKVGVLFDPLYRNRTKHALRLRASKTLGVSATNPMYSGMAYMVGWNALKGAHGQNLMAEAVWRPGDGGSLAYQII